MSLLPSVLNKLLRVRGFRSVKTEWLLRTVDLNHVKRFVIFIGNPRSGTTLIRSLLDAHSNVILSNEVHALQRMAAGESWRTVAGRIVENARDFSKKPVWTDYAYRVSDPADNKNEPIYILGDKKSGGTTKLIREEADCLDRLIAWSPVPVSLLHCVRNPYDVIATKTRKNGLPLERNIQRYFQSEQTAELASRIIGPDQCRRIYHEQLIERPVNILKDLLSFLGLTGKEPYLTACRDLIFDQPKRSRFDAGWYPDALASVERNAQACAHLAPYLHQGRLPFDQENDEKEHG